MQRWLKDRSGATAIEYALIAGAIAFTIVAAIGATGMGTNGLYTRVGSAFSQYLQ